MLKTALSLLLALQVALGGNGKIAGPSAIVGTPPASNPESVAAAIVSGQGLTWYGYYANCTIYTAGICSNPSDGSGLASISDESGNGNDLTSCVSGGPIFHTNQINTSLPAWTLGGTQDCFFTNPLTASSAVTVYIVLKATSASTLQDVIGCSLSCAGAIGYRLSSSHHQLVNTNTADLGNSTSTLSSGTWYQIAASNTSTAQTYYTSTSADGTASVSNSIATATNLVFNGGDGFFTGQVALIFIFVGSAPVNGTNNTNMLNALHARFGT